MRLDTFDIEIESLRWFSTFTQRSLGDAGRVEVAPAAELAAEHREAAEIAALSGEAPVSVTDLYYAPATRKPVGRRAGTLGAVFAGDC